MSFEVLPLWILWSNDKFQWLHTDWSPALWTPQEEIFLYLRNHLPQRLFSLFFINFQHIKAGFWIVYLHHNERIVVSGYGSLASSFVQVILSSSKQLAFSQLSFKLDNIVGSKSFFIIRDIIIINCPDTWNKGFIAHKRLDFSEDRAMAVGHLILEKYSFHPIHVEMTIPCSEKYQMRAIPLKDRKLL